MIAEGQWHLRGPQLSAFMSGGPESTCWPHYNHCFPLYSTTGLPTLPLAETNISFLCPSFTHSSPCSPQSSPNQLQEFPQEIFSRTCLLPLSFHIHLFSACSPSLPWKTASVLMTSHISLCPVWWIILFALQLNPHLSPPYSMPWERAP